MSCGGNYVVPGADPCAGTANITITAGDGIVVAQPSPGDYIISLNDITTTFTFPVYNAGANQDMNTRPNSVGGGNPQPFANIPILPTNFDAGLNPTVTLTLIMAGTGTFVFTDPNSPPPNPPVGNEFGIGIYDNTNVPLIIFNTGFVANQITFNWGTTIGDPLNRTIVQVVPTSQLLMSPFYGAFLSFVSPSWYGTPFAVQNMLFSLKMEYLV